MALSRFAAHFVWCALLQEPSMKCSTMVQLMTVLAMLLMAGVPCRAQRVSMAAGVDVVSYLGDELEDRHGSRAGSLTLRYAPTHHTTFGLGASIASFDVTGTGSSFTSYTIFLEPALAFSAGHYRTYAGPRIGWEQERLGSDISHVGGS